MLKSKAELKEEIDQTLDRLLENDQVLSQIRAQEGYDSEVLALEKLQESLMAHLMHLDELLAGARSGKKPLLTKQIAKKLRRNEYVRPEKTKPRVPRRRTKRPSHATLRSHGA